MAMPLSTLVSAAYYVGYVEARFCAIIILVRSPDEIAVEAALVLTMSLPLLTVVLWWWRLCCSALLRGGQMEFVGGAGGCWMG
jgi:hypothetical protein